MTKPTYLLCYLLIPLHTVAVHARPIIHIETSVPSAKIEEPLCCETIWQNAWKQYHSGDTIRGKQLLKGYVDEYLQFPINAQSSEPLFVLIYQLYSEHNELEYALQLLQQLKPVIAEKVPLRLADYHYHKAYIHSVQQRYETSTKHYSEITKGPFPTHNPKLLLNALCYTGWNYRHLGDYEKAIRYFKSYQVAADSVGYTTDVIDAGCFMANIYELQGKHPLALKQYYRALHHYQQKEEEERVAWCLNAIGSVFERQGDLLAAGKYLKRSYRLYLKLKIPHGIATSQRDLGKLLLHKGKPDSALHYFRAARTLRGKHQLPGYSEILNLSATAHSMSGNTSRAIELLMESYSLAQGSGNLQEQNSALNRLCEMLITNKAAMDKSLLSNIGFSRADAALKMAEKLSRKHSHAKTRLQTLELLSSYYDQTGKPLKALQYYKAYQAFHDSLYGAGNMLMIQNIKRDEGQGEQYSTSLQNAQNLHVLPLETGTLWLKWMALLISFLALGYLVYIRYKQWRQLKTTIASGNGIYPQKPFEPGILRYQINHALQSQEQARKEHLETQVGQASTDPDDHPFVKRVKILIEDHIDDPEFTVAILSDLMKMSRTQLYRKLKYHTGMAPNSFIRHVRMNIALYMLRTQDLNIAEAAYRTGFSNPGYFTKCFKETFGFTPSSLAHTINRN